MVVSAKALNKSLGANGRIAKTLTIEHVTILTDVVTGKSKRRVEKSNHAVVEFKHDDESVTVDLEALRGVIRTMGKESVDIRIFNRDAFSMRYASGGVTLTHMHATPGLTIDLDIFAPENCLN